MHRIIILKTPLHHIFDVLCILVYNPCICTVQLKKITITRIYGFKLYYLSLIFFILISFGYTHEFTLSFFFSFLFIEFLMIYLY